jgi:hypothetical protein
MNETTSFSARVSGYEVAYWYCDTRCSDDFERREDAEWYAGVLRDAGFIPRVRRILMFD